MAILWLRKSRNKTASAKAPYDLAGTTRIGGVGYVRARRSRSSRPPRGSGRAQRSESAARALAARRKGLLIRTERYPKFPLCASELSYDCAKCVDWLRAVFRLQRDAMRFREAERGDGRLHS